MGDNKAGRALRRVKGPNPHTESWFMSLRSQLTPTSPFLFVTVGDP